MNEGVKHRSQAVLVVPQYLHSELASNTEHTLNACDTEPIHDVLCQPEWYPLRGLQFLSL